MNPASAFLFIIKFVFLLDWGGEYFSVRFEAVNWESICVKSQ